MDVREKLVELLSEKCMETCKQRKGYVCSVEECKRSKEKCCGFYADHLIANGVTVQEWISVDDRLPDSCGFPCLLCGENSFGQIRVFEGFTGYMERGKLEWHSNQKDIDIDVWTITNWMPLPQPPTDKSNLGGKQNATKKAR